MPHRIFIAINLPDNLKKGIFELQQKLAKFDWPVRWEPTEKIHLTLRFLGNITDEEVEQLKLIIGQSAKHARPFSVSINSFLVLPDFYEPHAICLNVVENEKLLNLQAAIANDIEEQGIGESERHPFAGHITIGRVKPIRVNYRALTKMEFTGKFEVNSVEIMESAFKPGGSVYQVVQSFELI